MHHALAVLQRRLANEGAKGGLVIDLAKVIRRTRRHRQAFGRGDRLLRIGGVCLGKDGGCR